MADNTAEVKIGANTQELNTGMTQAETKVSQSTSAISQAFESMRSRVSASVSGMNAHINTNVSMIGSAFGKLNGMIGGIAAVLAGGAIFGKVISDTNEWTGQVVGLSKSLGITTQEASGLAGALQKIGVSTETYTSASQRLNRQVITHEQELNKLGLATKDASGKILDQQTLMKNAVTVLSDYEQGTSRNMLAQRLFGRGVGDVSALMKMLGSDFEESKKRAAELGLEVGPEGAAKARQFKEGLNDVKLIAKALEVQIGNALLPTLIELGKFFSDVGPNAVFVMKGALSGYMTVLEGIRQAFAQFLNIATGLFAELAIIAERTGKTVQAALKGDWGGVAGAWKGAWAEMKGVAKGAWDDIIKDAEKSSNRLASIWGLSKTASAGAPSGGKKTYNPGDEGAGKEDKSRMGEWENELKQRQIDEQAWFGISLADERAFWEQKKAIANSGSGELQSVISKINETIIKEGQKSAQDQLVTLKEEMADNQASWDARLKAAAQYVDLVKKLYVNDGAAYTRALNEAVKLKQQQADEVKKINESITDNQRKLADMDIQIEEQKTQWLRSIGAITDEQEVAELRRLYDRKHELDIQYLEQKRALEKQGSLEYQKITNEILLTDKQYQQKKQVLEQQDKTATIQRWREVGNSIAGSFSSAIQGMITGGQTFKQAIVNLGNSVLNTFIDMGVKMAADWVMRQLTMTTATQTQESIRSAAVAVGAATTEGITTTSATSQITKNAAVAASGAASAEAGIPYVGPALAAAAAAAMLALVMGFTSMASASGGWGQIPEDQISMVHKDEMILPANLATGIRSMISGGKTPAAPTSNSKTNINIKAFDSKDVVKTMRKLHRNNSLTGK